jgi:hypothetical protein
MVTELGGSVFEITHDLIGDLFRAKNASVTGETETAKRGPRVGDRERERWRGLVGRKGGLGWAAAQQGKEESGPKHKLDILQIKDLSFELRFEIEFEFVSLLKFKLHTFELQINQRKTNSHILPYFKHMFYKWDNLVKNLEKG